MEGSQLGAGGANGRDLGMCRGVVVGCHAVDACGNDLSVTYNDGSEGASAVFYILDAGIYGHLHEFLILLSHYLV